MTDAIRRAAVAERAARAGGAVARGTFRETVQVETKSDKNDLVTEADRDAQRQVIATVREEFANEVVVGEEDAVPAGGPENGDAAVDLRTELPEGGDAWVVDPIDGTTNYTQGLRLWATVVAAVTDGEVVGAATYLPTVEDMYAASPESATRNGQALTVSDATDAETFSVAPVGRYGRDDAERLGDVCETVVERLGDLRRFGSMQATLAFVASGELEAAFTPSREAAWDWLAGAFLVREAGGTVTDLAGDPWTPDSEGMVASNGEAHEAVREVARVAAERTGPEG